MMSCYFRKNFCNEQLCQSLHWDRAGERSNLKNKYNNTSYCSYYLSNYEKSMKCFNPAK